MVGSIRVAAVDESLGREGEGWGFRDANVVWVEGLHSGRNARKCGWDQLRPSEAEVGPLHDSENNNVKAIPPLLRGAWGPDTKGVEGFGPTCCCTVPYPCEWVLIPWMDTTL
jgi:hypothetical protein